MLERTVLTLALAVLPVASVSLGGCGRAEDESSRSSGREGTVEAATPDPADRPASKTPAGPSSTGGSPPPAVVVTSVGAAGASDAGGEAGAGASKKPKRWLGIATANRKEPIPGAPPDRRAIISRALRGGPAQAAGLQAGDVLIEAQGKPVYRYQDYLEQARSLVIGDFIELAVLRDGRRIESRVEMVAKPEVMNTWRRDHFPGTQAFSYDLERLKPQEGAPLVSDGKPDRHQVLYFWATWCGPCRKTSPRLERAMSRWGDRVEVLAISSEVRADQEPFVQRSKHPFAYARDPYGALKHQYEVHKLPTVVAVAPGGTVLGWDYGVPGVQRVIQLLDAALEKAAASP